jgi:hypothetical protein
VVVKSLENRGMENNHVKIPENHKNSTVAHKINGCYLAFESGGAVFCARKRQLTIRKEKEAEI